MQKAVGAGGECRTQGRAKAPHQDLFLEIPDSRRGNQIPAQFAEQAALTPRSCVYQCNFFPIVQPNASPVVC